MFLSQKSPKNLRAMVVTNLIKIIAGYGGIRKNVEGRPKKIQNQRKMILLVNSFSKIWI